MPVLQFITAAGYSLGWVSRQPFVATLRIPWDLPTKFLPSVKYFLAVCDKLPGILWELQFT
jgi:hypothetical protein